MDSWYLLVYTASLFVLAMLYFRIAKRHKIVDLPNHRTMHEGATIRGGGVIILLGVFVFSWFFQPPDLYFSIGLAIIGITGFLDDMIDLSSKIRFPIQAISIFLIFMDIGIINESLWIVVVILVVATGVLNAYNFMDGINGITAGYSLIALTSLLFVNEQIQHFVTSEFIYAGIIAVLVFSYFNFRKKAICFAGDVGSLSIAFIIIYLILKLMFESQDWMYILFLTLYGIDTIFTIIQRLGRGENIFEAHRLHFFQVVVRGFKLSHLSMSAVYMVAQLIINIIVISLLEVSRINQILWVGGLLSAISIIYIYVKIKALKLA